MPSLEEQEVRCVKRKRSRWIQADPKCWSRNLEKAKRISGLPYVSSKGTKQAPKNPKPADCSLCKYSCNTKFTDDDRQKLCRFYWQLDYTRKKDFIIKHVKCGEVKSRRPRNEKYTPRSNTKSYFFSKDDVEIRVCQHFFCKTLNISNIPILNAFKSVNEFGNYTGTDSRGKSVPKNKTPPEIIQKIKDHIESFPVTESHYTRKSTKRQYLDCTLNIAKMHNLFLEKCKENNEQGVSLVTYRRIFCTHFNLSFFKPKKDQCLQCSTYQKSDNKEKAKLEENYKSHIARKNAAYEAKNADKERSKNDPTFCSITCDLQSVLHIPCSDVSITYYLRKLNLYNFTIYEAEPPNNAYCYFWTETNGKRGSCEIGTCLGIYIDSLPSNVEHVTIFSDTCGGQNRNIQVAAFLLHLVAVHPTLKTIEQKFLESGHSFMEADSMHSAIESRRKNLEICSPHEWENVFRSARKKNPYKTKELTYKDFLDLKTLAHTTINNSRMNQARQKVNWLKIKCLKYEKQNIDVISYRYDYNEEYKDIPIKQFCSRKNRKETLHVFEAGISTLYQRQLPITEAKKKDLLTFCKKNLIPPNLHSWYDNLPSSKTLKEVTPLIHSEEEYSDS